MKQLRLWSALGLFVVVAAVTSSIAVPDAHDPEGRGFGGGTYLTTIKDSAGNFASRSIITFHADHAMSAVDSGQGGPTFFFCSQQGSWKLTGSHSLVARTMDFSFPPGGPGIARADYTIAVGKDRGHVEGGITVVVFPLEDSNPLEGEGTILGSFTFVGELIRP